MLHQFSLNRLSQNSKAFILGLGLLSSQAFSQTTSELPTKTPGALATLEELVELHNKQYIKLYKKIKSETKLITNFEEIKDIQLDPYFVKSILFHSNKKYLSLNKSKNDECFFYSLIENDLLKTALGKIDNIIVHYKDKDNAKQVALVAKDNFFQMLYSKKCFNNKEMGTIFKDSNIAKTVTSLNFSVPKVESECEEVLNDWQSNPYTPYICKISEAISKGKHASKKIDRLKDNNFRKRGILQKLINNKNFYTKNIPFFQRTYISNLCENITNAKQFCSVYLAKDAWTKVINGERPKYLMSHKCKNVRNKKRISLNDIKACANKFNKEPEFCSTEGNKNFSSLYPLQNCNTLSDAFNKSRLTTNYHDCPGRIDNQGITNIHRIINHITDKSLDSTPENCAFQANYSFAKLNMDFNNEKAWPMKICYINKVTKEEKCELYIPGNNKESKYSENNVVAKILYKNEGADENEKCTLVDSKVYNPVRLEYRTGCFIIYERETCTTLHCPKKVIYNKKEVSDLKYIGVPTFDYFPNSFSNEKFSAVSILSDLYRISKRNIKNLTDLHFFFKQHKKGIIHGVGCAEDLLPAYFQKRSLNSCKPLPFIIDGVVEKNKEKYLIFRSSIDDIHSPRLMKWNYIFSAVASYRELHPLSTWALYGIKK